MEIYQSEEDVNSRIRVFEHFGEHDEIHDNTGNRVETEELHHLFEEEVVE
jgi:hypothetical protein